MSKQLIEEEIKDYQVYKDIPKLTSKKVNAIYNSGIHVT